MKNISIIGTVGLPVKYGGFETFGIPVKSESNGRRI